jgi:hypothetical protein
LDGLAQQPFRLEPEPVGGIRREEGEAPLKGAAWYSGGAEGAGLTYHFPAGSLLQAKLLVADMLLDGSSLATFLIALQEGEKGRVFQYAFGALPQCSLRVRMALDLVDQNRFFLSREGGLLKPMCLGDRVDLDKVDRMAFTLRRKAPGNVRWCMTPLTLAAGEVERIASPVLPKGVLLDEFGQSAIRDWPGKTTRVEELRTRIAKQYESASKQSWPEAFSFWGGWKSRKLGEATGFFRTHHDGRRWWLADPDGYAFWSAGIDDVRVDCDARYDGLESALKWLPDAQGEFSGAYRGGGGRGGSGTKSVNYLAANLIRALGPEGWRDKWARIALAELKRLRFNTVGNWSETQYAREARFPYVRGLTGRGGAATPRVFRDFPDVFHSDFSKEAGASAEGLRDTAGDAALIGYFLMNEPNWGSSSDLPAVGMLCNTESCATRVELVRFLKTRYADDAALAASWKMAAGFDRIATGKWSGQFTREAQEDLEAFSVRMVEHYFQVLSTACRAVDPHHLNLGMRWAGVPPTWAVEGMKVFDVFSLNRYNDTLPLEQAKKIHDMVGRPVMVGEFHFGALDVGLPASGIGHLRNQQDRAKAYRNYVEDAAADPYCVGTHWFTLYDESALGRSDGENYNIGFLDICNRTYDELGRAAIASHERIYEVADGRVPPFHERLEYLPKLYL